MHRLHSQSFRRPCLAGAAILLAAAVRPVAAQAVQAERFAPGSVQLLDGSYFKQLQDLQEGSSGYLSYFTPDNLLYRFRAQAGLSNPSGATGYGGWDAGFIRGHMTGHYLSAASRMYALTGDTKYLDNVNAVVAGLGQVQDKNGNGYLSAFSSSAFDTLEAGGQPDPIVPYYTIHKIMAGLNDVNTYTGNAQALNIDFKMADYFVGRVSKLTPAAQTQMVDTQGYNYREFGGMNELLADLSVKAKAAGNDSRAQSYLTLADVFNHHALMDQIAAGNDVLNGTYHANTHIPQAIGWARYGQVTGDPNALKAASNFWDMVTRNHCFVNGGTGVGEFFQAPGVETGTNGSNLSWNTEETCCAYNMLKLSGSLFEISPQQKYVAYAENTLINDVLASLDPKNGVTTYFMALQPGQFKSYNTKDQSFWCCTGTGLENPTRYADLTYAKAGNALYVNMYMPSKVTWDEKGITLTQNGDSTTAGNTMGMTVNTSGGTQQADMKVRIPSWAYGDVGVKINGQSYQGEVNRGDYLDLNRQWNNGDQVELTLNKKLYLRRSTDDPNMVSVFYGPVLLAGALGTEGLPGNDQQIVNTWDNSSVSIPSSISDIINANDANPETYLRPIAGQDMQWMLYNKDGTSTGIIFKPFFDAHHERYSVYWQLNAPAGTRTWRGGGTYNTLKEGLNWDLAAAPGDSIAFDGKLTTTVSNDYAAGTSFGGVTFNANAAAFTVGGNRMAVQGNVSNLSSNRQTLNTDLALPSGNHTFHAQSADLVIGGQVSGAGDLTKTGSGRLVLRNNNSYTGTTTVSAGRLDVGDGGTTGSLGSGAVTLSNNATLAFNRSDNTTLGNSVSGTGQLMKLGTGTMTVTAAQQYAGATSIQEGTLRLGGGQFALDFAGSSGSVRDGSGKATGFTRRLSGTANPTNDSGLVLDSASRKLSITSGGPSDFSGETSLGKIEAPGVNLSDLGLGAGSDFTISAQFTNAPSAANYRQYGVYVGDSAQRLVRGGYLALNGAQIFGVNNASGTGGDSALSYTSQGAPAAGGTLDMVLSRTGGVFSLSVNGVNVTPTAQLTELNNLSDLTLGVFALNTASGSFTVPLTRFAVSSADLPGANNLLPKDTPLSIASGATFDMNGADQTIGSLAGDAGSKVLLGNARNNTLTVQGSSGSTVFSGAISGRGGLTKSGASILTLAGNNTYAGPTTITGGTLIVDGTTGTGQTVLGAGATLSGNGKVLGQLLASGIIRPGDGLGVLSIGSGATLGSGSLLNIELGSGASDELLVSGLLTIQSGSTLQISLLDGYVPHLGDSLTIVQAQNITGQFSTTQLPTLNGGLSYELGYKSDSVTVTVVPEPTGLCALVLAATLTMRRRRPH